MSKSISVNLGRTVKTNIVLYSTDNKGRDGYITYNDGGFWKDNIRQIKQKPDYPRHKYGIFHSLYHQAAPINYYSDGNGRDGYVVYFNAGLVKEFKPLANKQVLSQYLRENSGSNSRKKKQKVTLSSMEKLNLLKCKQIQKNVVDRLYDQCIEKFCKKNNARPVSAKSALFKNKFFNTDNNFKIKDDLNNSPIKINKKNTAKIMKSNENCDELYCKTSMNNFPKIEKKNNKFGYLKNSNSINVLRTFNNEDNAFKSKCWNPILNTEIGKNMEMPFIDRNFKVNTINTEKEENTNVIKNEENEKTNVQKNIEINCRNRPKSHRRFNKVQILNRYKPFLVDDFKDYGGYD